MHMSKKIIATNRKAKFQFHLYDRFEAGIALVGTEIKSIRAGSVSLKEAFVHVDDGEAWLVDSHIAVYEPASYFNHAPKRRRKLLLHKKEIKKLWEATKQKGMTVVPTQMYLVKGRAKVEITLAKGKKLHDKRKEIQRREVEREIERQARERR